MPPSDPPCAKACSDLPKLTSFVPFDPSTKISEAMATDAKGRQERIVKGAFTVVAAWQHRLPTQRRLRVTSKNKVPVLAVAAGARPRYRCSASSRLAIRAHRLRFPDLGIEGTRRAYRHGDGRCAGDRGHCCPRGRTGRRCVSRGTDPEAIKPEDFAVFASILPEGNSTSSKHSRNGSTSGCAETRERCAGAAPGTDRNCCIDCHRRGQIGSRRVLTEAGLGGIVAAVKEGRVTFQRILTYTLNSVLKKIVQVLLLAVGLVMTGHAVLTPTLMVIVMITGDFLAMSLTTDRCAPRPTRTRGKSGGSRAPV